MLKIKDIIENMKLNGTAYHDLNLLISKRVWLTIATLYYFSYLFTVWGFYFGPISLEYIAMITFHLYSVLVIATAWFFYSLCEYGIVVYLPQKKWLILFPIIIGIIATIIALLTHLGILWDLSILFDRAMSLIQ